jgi:hypothetical protein
MAWTIEYFVGSRFGGWARSALRFPTPDMAAAYITERAAAERRIDMTPLHRRPVKV